MSGDDRVFDAVERWVTSGMITPELAERLSAEALAVSKQRHRSSAQTVIGITAGMVLFFAAVFFGAQAWPELSDLSRALVLWGVGIGLLLGGRPFQGRARLRVVGYVLQGTGLALMLSGYAYSYEVWRPRTAGAYGVGIAAFVTPFLARLFSRSGDAVMPSVHVAAAYGFLYIFLNRVGFDEDAALWILDLVLIATLVFRGRRLLAVSDDRDEAVLFQFVTSLFAGFVLVFLTLAVATDAGDGTLYGLDAWLALVIGILMWGIHRAPARLMRSWYETLLGLCVAFGGFLVGVTLSEPLNVDDSLAALGAALFGGVSLAYAVRARSGGAVLIPACLVIVIGSGFFAIDRGGAIGAVLALAFAAAVLFWVAARLGRDDDGA